METMPDTKFLVAKAPTSTVELMIEETSNGSGVPVLQHFPTTVMPRAGETIEIGGVGDEFHGEYEVKSVRHTFNVGEKNRHTIRVEVKRIK
jgi:hypothetical protein